MTKRRILVLILVCTLLVGCGKKKEEYKCEEGFKIVGDLCTKEDIKNPIISPGCPEGYDYSGRSHKCEKPIPEAPLFTYTCEDKGFQINKDYKCEGIGGTPAKRNYMCDNGELSGTNCITKVRNDKAVISTVNCEHGTRNKWNKCEDILTPDIDKYPNNSGCPDGYVTNAEGKCYYVSDSSYTYSCPDGYILENNTCYAIDIKPASVVLSCDEDKVLSGSECRGKEIRESSIKYYCIDGMELDKIANKCIRIEYRELEDLPQCEKDYQLIDNKCKKTETKPAEKN